MNEKDIITLIKNDEWMMNILRVVKSLNLQDWWICAGFVRSKIWDTLHGFRERTPLADIDVVYFDPINLEESFEKKLEEHLKARMPNIPWSVKNEARMHLVNNLPPYSSSVDAISKFPETATALGVTLDEHNELILIAPHGISDAVNMIVRPTPFFMENEELMDIYRARLVRKNWKHTWKNIKFTNVLEK